ncbi:flagellar brake domain-containing protein [Bacillaceae bacterium Marseille-Q3522]|nr:flagellar brake domain-containing protein [Bacillaceae bacterium Marseille-Q3522]
MMMLKIGNVLLLEINDNGEMSQYKCKLVGIESDKLSINYPANTETNRTAFLINGTVLKATFVTEEGIAYSFPTKVIGRTKEQIPILIIAAPKEGQMKRIQRRQFVRIATAVDVAVSSFHHEFQPFTTVTEDISAGGAALFVKKGIGVFPEMIVKTMLVLPMPDEEYKYMTLKSKVVRKREQNNTSDIISVEFLNPSALERQALLRFTFYRQLRIKKKGIGV